MKKRLFKRAAAFVVASLMAIGVITVLPDGCLPQIGAVISAEEAEAGGVAINETNFPDDVFRQYILRFDSDSDDFLSNEEINQITVIDLLHGDVQTFKGIEYFTSLTRLLCAYNQLTSLDVSKNTALTYLECQDNQLTSLDVSKNTALTYLRCHGNQITSLDVSNNTLLTHLYCSQLTSLNVSNNTALIELSCSQNKLTSLDVSNNTMLEFLDCSDNLLTSLNVSNNTALTYLRCDDNQLTSLDVSNNTVLIHLGCSSNQLTSLDVSKNTELTILGCSSNQLTSLDVSHNTALILLNCLRNQLTSLDVSNNTALTTLHCDGNKLTSLDVSNNTALTTLHCDGNKLTSLDVSNNTHLEDFRCYENQLMSLDVSNNIALRYLMCDRNKLTTLDVSNSTALTVLSCESNQLASLDVSNNALITQLICDDNVYNIGETCGTYDLKNLPTDFNITKTSNWQGATLKDGKLTEIDGTGTITYDYDCGNNHTATFSLIYDYAEHSYDDGVITTEPTEDTEGEKTYTCTNCGATKTEPIAKLENADGIEINSVNFPDEVFRQYVSDNFDKDNNGFLSNEEIGRIKEINVQHNGIQSLKGIEYFTALADLRCNHNQLTSLDVSNNTALKWLDCNSNQLTSLDVSNNTAFTHLNCELNQITSLDVSNNTELVDLNCSSNQLTSLDISNNTALVELCCNFMPLTSLDVSKNTALVRLQCQKIQISALDLSNNNALMSLVCSDNQLTSLDISNNTALINLDCWGNQLTSLDVSQNTDLKALWCWSNQLTSLDVSQNTDLKELRCDDNLLTSLDLSNNSALTNLECDRNYYTIGEICGIYELKNLPTGFDLTKASNWQGATLKDDMLTEIDGTISYDYNCGNNHTATFKLTYDLVDHTYDDGVITTEPTEDTEGEKTYTCTNCGATKTEPIEKLEHVHKQDDELMSDATGHWYTCSGCTEKLDFATHTEDSGTVTVEPTEATEGQKVYTCTVCGYTTRTDVVAKLEHVHNKGTELVSDGTGHWYTCSGCGEKLDFSTHMEDNGTVTLAPTVTTEGQKVYKCTVCGYTTRTETIAKLEHVHNKGTELVSDGTGHWYTCGSCDEKLDFATHTEDSGTVTLAPTVTTEGQRVYKCTVCGYTTRTETIAKLENGNTNPSKPSQPTTPTTPTNPTNPTNPTTPQQPATNESDTIISAKNGWGNVVKQINAANENSKITVDMGNTTNVPKNVMNAIKGKNIDIVLDMGDGITWTINGKDVTNPQSLDFSVTKKKNSISQDMILSNVKRNATNIEKMLQ